MSALEVHDLHVYLGDSHILQGVTFTVPDGGVTGVIGRNGVGKTTTLRALLGLAPRSRGTVLVGGADVTSLPTHEIIRLGIGYVPEDREVFAGLTVGENLRLASRVASPDYDLVYQLFPVLRDRTSQRAGTLSGGEQQMVAIARALLNRDGLLLIDEPTKGLAPRVVSEVAMVLERIGQLTTVVLVEQNLPVLQRLARHVVVLDGGQVVHEGPAAGVLDDPAQVRRFLGVHGGGA